MTTLFGDTTIRKMVMAVVEAKITTAQQQFDEAKKLHEQTRDDEVLAAEDKLVKSNQAKAQELVTGIVGKFI